MIIGHRTQQKRLKALFKKNNIPHALLFSGPEEIGKRTTALWFLRMINCLKEDGPCLKCRSCYEIEEKIHPDVFQIFPEEKEVKIKQIQEITEKSSYKGVKARFKGFIINDAHLMNAQAQNSLLKTLEEPTGSTIIILVTSYPYMLFPTVLSRLFEMKFHFVSEKEISKKIESEEVTRLAMGRPGRAINYLEFPEKILDAKKEKEVVKDMFKEDLSARFLKIKNIIKEDKGELFLEYLLEALQEKIKEGIKEKKSIQRYIKALKETEEAIFLCAKTNVNMRLILEKIIIKI